MMDFTYSAIVARIRDRLQDAASRIEGTWSMDNVQAVAQELAMMMAMEVETIPDRVLIDTAEGEFLDRKAMDYGETRLEGESDDAFRARVLYKIQNPMTSGNENHYVYWAKQVQGVGEAKVVESWDGPGTVKVILLSDENDIPSDELVTAVADHIEALRPVCVDVTVSKAQPVDVAVDVTIAMLPGFTLADVQESVHQSILAYIADIAFTGAQLSYYRVGDRIFSADGVADITTYTVNGGTASLSVTYEQFFRLQEVTVHVTEG